MNLYTRLGMIMLMVGCTWVLGVNPVWSALPTGDFDMDQDVDGFDLFEIRQGLGGSIPDAADIEILALNFGLARITHARSISRFGTTWSFADPVRFGQFANEDYWVLGPVAIIRMDPPSIEQNGRTINGAMLDPSPRNGSEQGYDSSMYGNYAPHYQDHLNVARPDGIDLAANNPLVIEGGHSLVSSISKAEAGARPQLQTAAVLTILADIPPDGSFRPPYSGSDKTIRFQADQMRLDLLQKLSPIASTPDMDTMLDWFARPFIDHVPNWMAEYLHPEDNFPGYGRNISARIGDGALMLHLDLPMDDKKKLLIRYLQVGIDLYGVLMDGGEVNWTPNGGHASGRKWPILFAGLILEDSAMQSIGPGDGGGVGMFGEDGQTFYISREDVDRVHDPDVRNCEYEPYEAADIGMAEWGIRHAVEPEVDNNAWCAAYRRCCTANAWLGFVLAARIMDAKSIWNHDALFDYQDRYMALETPGDWQRSWSDFSEEMWDTYRDNY